MDEGNPLLGWIGGKPEVDMKLLSVAPASSSLTTRTNRDLIPYSRFRPNAPGATDEIHLRPIAVIRPSGGNVYQGPEASPEKGEWVDLYI